MIRQVFYHGATANEHLRTTALYKSQRLKLYLESPCFHLLFVVVEIEYLSEASEHHLSGFLIGVALHS